MGLWDAFRHSITGGTGTYRDIVGQRAQWVQQQLAQQGIVQPVWTGEGFQLTPEMEAQRNANPDMPAPDGRNIYDYFQSQLQQQYAQAQQATSQLIAQYPETLPPDQKQQYLQELSQHTDEMQTIQKYGKAATLATLAAIGGGAAMAAMAPAAGAAAGTGGTAAGAGGTATAGGTALEGQALANAMYGGTAAGEAGGFSSALGGAGAGTAAGGTAAGTAAATGGATAAGGSTLGSLGQMAAQYGPTALKVAGAALPLLKGGGGGGGGTGTGNAGTSGREGTAGVTGMMGGGVLGSSGLMGSPQEQTAQSNQLAQTRADWANRPDQTDMYGNRTTWSSEAVRDPATGQMINKWTNKIEMDPQQQAAINSQKNIQAGMMSGAEGLMGQATKSLSTPMDYSKFQQWGGVPQGDDAARQRMESMLMERMRPEHERQQAGLEAQVAAMGLTRGSQQWNEEMQRLGDQQSRAKFDAFQTAGNEMQNQYSRELQSANYANTLRGQQVGEAQQQRMQPLNDMNALRQGNQVAAPQFGSFATSRSPGGVDYNQQYAQQNAATQAGRTSTGEALLNIGTTLGSAYFNQPQQQQQQPGLMNGGYNSQTGQTRYS